MSWTLQHIHVYKHETLFYYWSNVFDAGPALNQHFSNVSRVVISYDYQVRVFMWAQVEMRKSPYHAHCFHAPLPPRVGVGWKLIFLITCSIHVYWYISLEYWRCIYRSHNSSLIWGESCNPYNAKVFLFKPQRLKFFFQFEININFLVGSFRLIWIHVVFRP